MILIFVVACLTLILNSNTDTYCQTEHTFNLRNVIGTERESSAITKPLSSLMNDTEMMKETVVEETDTGTNNEQLLQEWVENNDENTTASGIDDSYVDFSMVQIGTGMNAWNNLVITQSDNFSDSISLINSNEVEQPKGMSNTSDNRFINESMIGFGFEFNLTSTISDNSNMVSLLNVSVTDNGRQIIIVNNETETPTSSDVIVNENMTKINLIQVTKTKVSKGSVYQPNHLGHDTNMSKRFKDKPPEENVIKNRVGVLEGENTWQPNDINDKINYYFSVPNKRAGKNITIKYNSDDVLNVVSEMPYKSHTIPTTITPSTTILESIVKVPNTTTTTATAMINSITTESTLSITKISDEKDIDFLDISSTDVSDSDVATPSIEILSTILTSAKESDEMSLANISDTTWPVKHSAIVEGDVILGGLMMVHSREDTITCGPIMPQGGIQALEAMLFTLDRINEIGLLPNISLGAHILDDCDKDTYGLEMAVDFIKGKYI